MARKLARRFLDRAARGYETTGLMHEKYDVREIKREGDVRGAGGEYSPQVGRCRDGWSGEASWREAEAER